MPKKPPKPQGHQSVPRTKGVRNALLWPFPFQPPFTAIKKGTLRDLSRDRQLSKEEFDTLKKELETGPDRATAIIAALYAEDAIGALVRTYLARSDDKVMNELHGRDGPLSSFYSTILLAHGLGAIDETTKQKLSTIRQIRNAFAHAIRPISFQTPEVVDAVQKLQPSEKINASNARAVYIDTIWGMAYRLSRDATKRFEKQIRSYKYQARKHRKLLAAARAKGGG
jgi:DNA-binding MltR family transcriptional regulator